MAEEKSVNVTWRELDEGVERPSGAVHELVVRRAPVLVYNLEGLAFVDDGAVMLPAPLELAAAASARASGAAASGGSAETLQHEQPGEGLVLLCDLWAEPGDAQGKKCLVAAHTDRLPGAPALLLSERRARNVLAYLKGDKRAWADSCMPCHDLEWRAVLAWAARRLGYACDPGPLDGPLHADARRGLRLFRQTWNEEHGGELSVDGDIGAADFEAFFELYDAWIARVLGETDLKARRAKLVFLEPGAIGCGDAFPGPSARAPDRKPPRGRRVELLFFDGDEPNLELLPRGAHVYRQREFVLERLEVAHGEHVTFDAAWSADVVDALPESAELELSGLPGGPDKRRMRGGARDGGTAGYGFDWRGPGLGVTLVARAGEREVTLFEGQTGAALLERRDPSASLEQLLDDEPAEDQAQDDLFAGEPPELVPPAERAPSPDIVLVLRLHDAESRPMGGTCFRVSSGVEPSSGRAAADGFIELELSGLCPERLELEWGAETAAGPFAFSRQIFVACGSGSDRARLHNLGYDVERDFAAAARAFQSDYGVDHLPAPVGLAGDALPAASRARLDALFSGECDATLGG